MEGFAVYFRREFDFPLTEFKGKCVTPPTGNTASTSAGHALIEWSAIATAPQGHHDANRKEIPPLL